MKRKRPVNKKSNERLQFIEIILLIVLVIASIIFIKTLVNHSSTTISEANNTDIAKSKEENNENTATSKDEDTFKISQGSDITFNMLVTGDIMCHNSMYKDAYDATEKTYNFDYMFDDIKYYIQTADIAVGNLETTFAGSKVGYSNYPTFNTPEQLATTLKKIGFDVVSTANNHCMDKGYSGLVSTIKYLDEADLSHTGTYASEEASKEILIKNVKGVKIAFLSFTYGTNGIPVPKDKSYAVNFIEEDLILEQIELAKKENPDVICVSMHWGIEYQTKQNATQEKWADFLFKNGVDIIIGNHPHVLQPMEKRTVELEDGTTKDGFVVYSLGNFMADQNKQYTRDSALLSITMTKHKEKGNISIDSATYTPTYYYKNTALSTKKFKVLDIKNTLAAYDANVDTSIGKTMYNTLSTEIKNIQKILGDEIK